MKQREYVNPQRNRTIDINNTVPYVVAKQALEVNVFVAIALKTKCPEGKSVMHYENDTRKTKGTAIKICAREGARQPRAVHTIGHFVPWCARSNMA